MYSSKKNIQQLASLMLSHGVTDVVICPGSRNMPLAQTFGSHPNFNCHAVTDERSAGLHAMGLAIGLDKPVAVCVTSGSALLNLTSAVSEAYYQQVPLLIISADRPAAWIGQMDGQTLPQIGVFGTLIRKEVNLSEPHDMTDEWHNNRLINEAMLELNHHVKGPVHINIPLSEPFFECSANDLPQERTINRKENYLEVWEKTNRILLVVGQLTKSEATQIEGIIEKLNCAVVCENLSNLSANNQFVDNIDYILSQNMAITQPELIVYLGGHIVSKRLKNWIRRIHPDCWRIDANGDCSDTFQCVSTIIEKKSFDFLTSLSPKKDAEYKKSLLEIKSHAKDKFRLNDLGYSSVAIVSNLLSNIPNNTTLVLANSSVIRYAQLVSLEGKNVDVCCNRGVNGIDGSLSTAVGIAKSHPEKLTLLIIGDLSFFYDMNGLWNTNLPPNLRIAMINNGGGGIFRTLPNLSKTRETDRFVMAAHHTTAEGWIKSLDAQYCSAKNGKEALKCIQCLFDKTPRLCVAEFFTDAAMDESVHIKIYNQD